MVDMGQSTEQESEDMNWWICFISLLKMFLSVQKKEVEQEYLPHYPTGENCKH